MKKLMTLAFMAMALTVNAQEKKTIEVPQWINNIKFSGYTMLQYQAEDKEGSEHNEFNLRLARFILDGKIGDFDWRAQIQGTNAKGPGEPTVQLVDLYAEWNKYKEVRVKVGQFKRAFTFDSPSHPITQGWYSYGLVVNNLVGYGDRTGEKASGGRDIGIQVQGSLFPMSDNHRLLHYQLGIYNGEGINKKDADNQKDIIGGLWVMPIQGLRIGAFGWTGTKAEMDFKSLDLDAQGNRITTKMKSVRKNRYAISAEYDKNEYLFRAEYIHSQGWGTDEAWGDKADGWYAFGIVPIIKSKLHAKARYNVYRRSKDWESSKTMYEIGANYFFNKKLQLNFEYARVNDRTLAKSNYNFVDLELDFRF